MADYVLVEKSDGVAILTLNRPDQLNAMNRQLSAELHDAVTRAVADDEVGCIVITGAGQKAFSAGGDIHEQREDDAKYTQEELDALGTERARLLRDRRLPQTDRRHDQRPRLRRRRGAVLVARHARRLRACVVPIPPRRIRA